MIGPRICNARCRKYHNPTRLIFETLYSTQRTIFSWKGGERNCAGPGLKLPQERISKKKRLGQAANRTPDRSHAKGELYLDMVREEVSRQFCKLTTKPHAPRSAFAY
jgi:hypothetical protein